MIHDTPLSGKFRRLVRRLRPMLGDSSIAVETAAVGLLERMWHVGISGAIRGDIGRFDNQEIAEMIGWYGDADELIDLLVCEKWLDADDEHRLLIHDWQDHAPRHVKGNAAKQGGILSALRSGPNGINGATPDATQPNATIPDGRLGGRGEAVEPLGVDAELFTAAIPTMQRIVSVVQPDRPLKAKDRELCAKAALIAEHRLGMAWLDSVLKDIRDRSTPPDKPWGYLKGALAKSAERDGKDFYAAMRVVEIPESLLAKRDA